ncbi:MAG TPA: ATP-binding protein [Vicinamibacteria bacterium]|jgi:hypothetical protein
MGQTRVDLLHLLEDLRDAYPGSLEETILTEIIANSLDSGARRISVRTDPAEALLVVVDDGAGMARRELALYHDLAASAKQRGEGIGFAGVGIKLGLLVSEEVLTETRRGAVHVATRWRLASRHKAPWHWVDPPGFVEGRGTGVCLKLRNPLSALADAGFVEAVLRRHFEPLLDAAFAEVLSPHYPQGVELLVNGKTLASSATGAGLPAGRAPVVLRLPRKRRPAAFGYLERADTVLEEDRRGVAVSTRGKVIRRGWDWLGLMPAAADHVTGLIEAPGLAGALTLNKADFLRSGSRGLAYLGYRKAIQQAVAAQLAEWGEGREAEERAQRRIARPIERDLETVLVDLASDFPALAALVDQHAGGQRRLPSGPATGPLSASAVSVAVLASPGAMDDQAVGAPARIEQAAAGPSPGPSESEARPVAEAILAASARGPRRPARYGLTIQFEERRDSSDLGRLIEATVWVNTAHPAYRRAVASRAEGYHTALAVAMALAPLAAEPGGVHEFITRFLTGWGEAVSRDGRRRLR